MPREDFCVLWAFMNIPSNLSPAELLAYVIAWLYEALAAWKAAQSAPAGDAAPGLSTIGAEPWAGASGAAAGADALTGVRAAAGDCGRARAISGARAAAAGSVEASQPQRVVEPAVAMRQEGAAVWVRGVQPTPARGEAAAALSIHRRRNFWTSSGHRPRTPISLRCVIESAATPGRGRRAPA